ncbi:PDZ domain-containing protein [Nannocystis radixulma]|uniref:PDZ domain-containing protein n=1 Tax=Nannocystis radixulma TaxID=2995305 RepID=A0ABT5BK89_9BACT|nr:hypothetical protein [Nannocystis radixulma]MDC0674567.1 hypothetical protein [Nannocystis radixulma]
MLQSLVMAKRRTGAWSFVGLMLLGCDPVGRERAALQAELAATSALLAEHRAQIVALKVDLAKQQVALQVCEAGHKRPSAPELPAPSASEPGEPALTPVCSAGVCVVKRAEFDAFVAAPETAPRLARVIPAMRDGKTVGFNLYSIRAGSPLALFGFKNGDLVRSVNGEPIDGIDAALRLYSQMRLLDRWTIAGTRKGEPFELTIAVE